ncbi:hypothetical protein [Acidianus sp. HS-5]|uniref:hypothetical protein n=1 Tax=Acidianus sp. HS-5 TaxID=2886040 RepID=UPI001F4658F3|nr:hypothetical protein [Acidianus sp. HS-5]BDC17164.1 hypothetical protein HS5_00540 [Acidianus sp. HS-5]
MFLQDLIIVALLGLTHGLDPDHIASARVLRNNIKILKFALFHSLGFVILAVPLTIIFLIVSVSSAYLNILGNLVGIGVALILLISTLIGREFEIEPKKLGLLQGSLVVTPSKIITILLAISLDNIIYSTVLVGVFVVSSTFSIFALSSLNMIPRKLDKPINIAVALVTIIFLGVSTFEVL